MTCFTKRGAKQAGSNFAMKLPIQTFTVCLEVASVLLASFYYLPSTRRHAGHLMRGEQAKAHNLPR